MKSRTSIFIILVTAAFLTLTANWTFFRAVGQVYPLDQGNLAFVASVAVVLFCTITLMMSVFTLVLPVRVVASLFLVVAAVSGYYTDQFGTIIDSTMLENVAQTDVAEVRDLMTLQFGVRLLLFGVAATLLVWKIPLQRPTLLGRTARSAALGVAALGIMATTIFTFSDQYAGFFREHKQLRSYTNPLMPIYSGFRFAAAAAAEPENKTLVKTAEDAHISERDIDNDHELVIVVVGETARRDRFSLNGYARRTNPELEKESRLISYSHVVSCGTSTAISVPCMFSRETHNDFDLDSARHEENVLDILQRTGVSVLWRDNNSSSKGVADRVRYEDFKSSEHNPICDSECRDVGMLEGLQAWIDQQPGDILIVLHQMGNHGPAYFKRYPPEFERFKPACQSLDFADCTTEEINNAYDNAILYTDYFLSRVIQLLKTNTPHYETAMLYVSDHGESLGEHGLYLHGAPYFMAPREQTEVPVVLWVGESSDIDMEQTFREKDKQTSHDAVFNSLLAAFEVETSDLDANNTLFQVSTR